MPWLEYLIPLIFLAPLGATAAIVLALRNLHDARIRSPIDAHPLREPGQALRDRLDHAFTGLFLNGALGPIVILAPLTYGMGRMIVTDASIWLEWAVYGLICSALVLLFCLLLIRDFQRIRRLKLGLACELAVGQELERLIRPEDHPYFVFHDIPSDTFTIDHVALTPHGVFVIETRARTFPLDASGQPQCDVAVESQRLRFPGWSERQPLRKTRQAAEWMRHWLARECNADIPVRGVLVLPGWRIDLEKAPPGLDVVNGENLTRRLIDTPLGPLDPATHDRVAQALRRRGALLDDRRRETPSI
ncbi:nuclease-related domain-containing protein [Modicisalibacter tunisiensis]|uniref:NERD domain-containing protein n=1 Tax=Modicisalibacter tunisiensis TaxID=390637 RepID=A0ABS7WZT6_9GAMM|nr:nuclease-related domain-containing protein [Modicisalibacter tunisiensis]MBZ9567277.1 NERD domain-containing protein [Modicisalibacter tunisiensis]